MIVSFLGRFGPIFRGELAVSFRECIICFVGDSYKASFATITSSIEKVTSQCTLFFIAKTEPKNEIVGSLEEELPLCYRDGWRPYLFLECTLP